MKNNLLFLTGLPRSGTTWLASVIGVHQEINYISGEIFNPGTSPQTFGLENLPWFINEETLSKDIKDKIPKALSLKTSLLFSLKRIEILVGEKNLDPKNYLRIFKHLFFSLNKKANFTKDPIGLFMVNYFYENYNAKIVIVKRNPYRFIASMKRMNWYLNFNYLPLYFKERYSQNILDYKKKYKDNLVYNVLIWWLIQNDYCKQLQDNGIKYLEVEHEQLLHDPVSGFNKILKFYGFEMDKNVSLKIDYYLSQKNKDSKELNETHQMNRSKSQIKNSWKNYLTNDDIDLIKTMTNLLPPD